MAYVLKTDFLKDFPKDRTFGQMAKPYGYVTIHNAASSADARALGIYGNYNSPEVSYHFAVDEKDVYHLIPLDWTAWHSGNSTGNRESIGIEITRDMDYSSDRYARAEENAAILAAWLLKRNGLGVDRLRRHYDWNGKICPHRMFEVEAGKTTGRTWAQFKALVAQIMADDKQADPTSGAKMYTVKRGDTLADIATAHKTTVEKLVALNGIKDINLIHPGQVLQLAEVTPTPTPDPKPMTVRLAKGTPIFAKPPTDFLDADGIFSITDKIGRFGKLKSGRGYVLLPEGK